MFLEKVIEVKDISSTDEKIVESTEMKSHVECASFSDNTPKGIYVCLANLICERVTYQFLLIMFVFFSYNYLRFPFYLPFVL